MCRLLIFLLASLLPGSAWAEKPVVSAELVGSIIKGSTTEARVHRMGDSEWSLRVQLDWTIEFVSKDQIRPTFVVTVYDRGATQKRPAEAGGLIRLGKPAEARDRGGGDYIWTFEEGVLTLVRSYKSGAQTVIFAVTRSRAGFDCTASVSWFHEAGTPNIMLRRGDGTWMEIVSSKQESSSCAVEPGRGGAR
jgi:hypothetical protein